MARAIACLFALALGAGPASAAFDDAPFGARDAAMGGGFTAVHDEVSALAYNPAALGHAPALEAAAPHTAGKTVLKVIVVPGRLVSIVVK